MIQLSEARDLKFPRARIAKYSDLQQECEDGGWGCKLFPAEVGCRRFAGQSLVRFLVALGVYTPERREVLRRRQQSLHQQGFGFGTPANSSNHCHIWHHELTSPRSCWILNSRNHHAQPDQAGLNPRSITTPRIHRWSFRKLIQAGVCCHPPGLDATNAILG